MKFQKGKLWAAALALAFSFSVTSNAASLFGNIEVQKLIVMPNSSGHADWIDAINGATSSVRMTMYHLTDTAVVNALINKAKDKAVDLRLIVDGKGASGGYAKAIQQLTSAGVQVRESTPGFSLTHSKDMVVDGKTAFIGAINLTNTATNSRDFAIVTPDIAIIAEIEKVFEADWLNAQNKTTDTPTVSNGNLAWSPINADAQLVKLIGSASANLVAETENFSSTDIINALNQAAARGVDIRLIIPECSFGNADRNYQGIAQLNGVHVHVEHDGRSIQQPYMHSKMMVADGQTVYVGSINSSLNSINNDRELGVIFADSPTANSLVTEFEKDWNRSQVPASSPSCAASMTAAELWTIED